MGNWEVTGHGRPLPPAHSSASPASRGRWSAERARAWHGSLPWLLGCNFIPSSAVNQLEMWQADTYDPQTTASELDLAAAAGMNCVRVYLHDLLWEQDADGFCLRLSEVLALCEERGIRMVPVLFDSCWNPEPKLGRQPQSVSGVHNSGWVQSPGAARESDPTAWRQLERYVRGIVAAFGSDPRVLFWDVYNEPATQALPLMRQAFQWARAAGPSQPLTSAVYGNAEAAPVQLELSDIVTFHNYGDAESLAAQIADLRSTGRPLICTEWLARTRKSTVASNLPVFRREEVGCICWGLVAGKTQTIFPWGSKAGASEPKLWFHDLFHKDGRPYDPAEVLLLRDAAGLEPAGVEAVVAERAGAPARA